MGRSPLSFVALYIEFNFVKKIPLKRSWEVSLLSNANSVPISDRGLQVNWKTNDKIISFLIHVDSSGCDAYNEGH